MVVYQVSQPPTTPGGTVCHRERTACPWENHLTQRRLPVGIPGSTIGALSIFILGIEVQNAQACPWAVAASVCFCPGRKGGSSLLPRRGLILVVAPCVAISCFCKGKGETRGVIRNCSVRHSAKILRNGAWPFAHHTRRECRPRLEVGRAIKRCTR